MKTALPFAALLLLFFAQGCTSEANIDPTPSSVSLDELQRTIDSRAGRVVVVNFWATWCLPCRIEFPELVRFGKNFEDQGVDIMFVSIDFESDLPVVVDFLKEHDVPWQSYITTEIDFEFVEAFHKQWTGAIPATFVYDRDGNLRAFWEGITSYDELEKIVGTML